MNYLRDIGAIGLGGAAACLGCMVAPPWIGFIAFGGTYAFAMLADWAIANEREHQEKIVARRDWDATNRDGL